MTHRSSCMVLWKFCELSSATSGPEHGHVTLMVLVATEPHFLHLMSCSWYRTLLKHNPAKPQQQQLVIVRANAFGKAFGK